MWSPRTRDAWLVGVLLASILALNLAGARHLSVTYDEPSHFRYGQQILAGDATRFDDSKMPFSALNAGSSALIERLQGTSFANADARVAAGRFATMLFSLLTAVCVWRWSSDLYGRPAGLFALTLYAFEPNLLAHAQLVTTDIYATGTIAWALYAFWRFLRDGGWRWAMVSSLAIGAAQLAKYTAVFLFPLCAVIALGFHANAIREEIGRGGWAGLRRRAATATGIAVLVCVVSLLVVNAGFLFDRTFTPLSDYAFRSEMFRGLQRAMAPFGALPVPVPYPYLEGLDWIVQRERTGEGYGSIYLLGELRRAQGFTGYYLVAALYKVPVAVLVIWLAALASLAWRRGREGLSRHEWVLVCPLVFFTIYFNVFYRAQIGLRFFLIVFPLLHVLSGRLVRDWGTSSRALRLGLATSLVYLIASTASYYPHFIPYFNELVGNRLLAYRILADSNLDWRQHLWYLERYQAAHPDALLEPDGPTAGTIIVGINALTGVAGDPGRFRWLRDNFTDRKSTRLNSSHQ